ncbi:major facilitator superfamily domain-containing protein [Chytriomyces sp. MP71]|nr:major facilitator superfamily domain-containing protein [Chytriomyces sp. MP71]
MTGVPPHANARDATEASNNTASAASNVTGYSVRRRGSLIPDASLGGTSPKSRLLHLHSFGSASSVGIEAFSGPCASLAQQQNMHNTLHRRSMESGEDASNSEIERRPQTPLPAKVMTVLCIVLFCEPVSMTILFPFIYFMVRDFGLSSDKEVGYYVGFIASAFSLAQFCTSLGWGFLSDRVGRRPVLLVGLIGNAISLILFGQATTLRAAILSRMLCGVLNGNVGVAKCVIGEVTDETNQGLGFSLIGIMWSLGTIFGPVLGGLLSDPVARYPELFGGWEFLRIHKYFLPCFVSACVSLIGFVVGFVFLEETNKQIETPVSESGYIAVATESTSEEQFENDATSCVADLHLDPPKLVKAHVSESMRESILTMVSESRNSLTEFGGAPVSGSPGSSALNIEVDDTSNETQGEGFGRLGLPQLPPAFGRDSVIATITYSMLAFQNIVLEEAFSLWVVTPPEDGGLGYQPPDVGICLSIIGFAALYIQMVLYPLLSRRYTPVTLFHTGAALFPFPFILYPVISGILQPWLANPLLTRFLLLLNLTLRQLCSTLCFTSIFILINNSAAPGALGLVNGVAQTCAALVRSVGPALGGCLWAWSITNGLEWPFDYWFVFLALGVCAVGTFLFSLTLRDAKAGSNGSSSDEVCMAH